MAIDVSQLTIKVISDGIDKATNSLNKLAEASAKVESSTILVKGKTEEASAATSNASKTTTSYIDRLQAKVDLLGKNNAQTAAYTATMKGLNDTDTKLAAALGSQIDAWKELGIAQAEAIKMNKAITETEAQASSRYKQVAADAMARAEAQQAEIAAQRVAVNETNKAIAYSKELTKAQNAQMASTARLVDVNKSVYAAFSNSGRATKQQAETMGEVIASISPAERGLQKLAEAEERLHLAFKKGPKDAKEYAEGLALIAAQRARLVERQAATIAKATEEVGSGAKKLLTNAGVMREFFVILREGFRGDFSRMAGSISILVDRLGAMGIALAILTSPVTWLIAALGTVGILAVQGADEADKFNQALILTGNYAGQSAAQMEKAAAGMKDIAGQHAAAQALTEVANTGRFAGEQVVMIGKAALQMKEMTGQSVDATIKQFENLGKSPADAVYKLDEQYHFLTADTYEQIRALDEQGKHQEASDMAMKAYADTINQRSPQILENLGYFEKAWRAIKGSIIGAVNAAQEFGRQTSLQQQKKDLEEKLSFAGDYSVFGSATKKDILAQIDTINEAIRMANRASADTADNTRIQALGKEALKQADDHLLKMKGELRLQKEINEITERYVNLRKAEQNAPSKAYEEKLAGVKFNAEGRPVSGGLFDAEVADARKRSLRAAPRTNEYGIDAALQKNKNAIQEIVDNTSMQMKRLKAQYDRGETDTETYLRNEYLAKDDAYRREYELAQKNLEIAKQKKNVTAVETAQKEIKKIEDQAYANTSQYVDSLDTLDKKRADNVKKFTATLVDEYNARQVEIDNYLNSAGMSASQKDAMSRQLQAERQFNSEMRKLRQDLAKTEAHGGIDQATFDSKASAAEADYAKRLAQEKAFTAAKLRDQQDWVNGAKTAYGDYMDNATNVASSVQSVFTDGFKGMEDALTSFIQTGKLSFGSLVNTILAGMARIEAKKFMSSLMGGASGTSGGIFGTMMAGLGAGYGSFATMNAGVAASNGLSIADLAGAFADGGDPPVNQPSLVGERGPEVFIPKQAGTIIPNDKLGGGGTTITYAPTIHIDSRADRAQVMQDVQNAVKAGNAQLVDDLKRRRIIR